jgi:formylmethanofuran dehydrogenase subunit C
MKDIILKVEEIPDIGMEAECISPDMFAGKTLDEIRKLKVYVGNKRERLGKFFKVEGNRVENAGNLRIVVEGNVGRVKRIGQGMAAGEILIKGDAGMHLGSKMRDGRIIVEGDAGSWAGMEMTGGRIIVKGDAGNFTGSAYRGNCEGMKGGDILIHGNAGSNTGACMSDGNITIKGDGGQFLGVGMRGGLITIEGDVPSRAGAEMHSGTIIVKGKVEEMLPSFRREGVVEKTGGKFLEYTGDLAEDGKGKIYVKGQRKS